MFPSSASHRFLILSFAFVQSILDGAPVIGIPCPMKTAIYDIKVVFFFDAVSKKGGEIWGVKGGVESVPEAPNTEHSAGSVGKGGWYHWLSTSVSPL